MKEVEMICGKKKVVNGVNYFSQELCTDGFEYGYVYKNDVAFHNNPDEICYIPEHAFDNATPVEIDGERYYSQDEVGGYTRKMLEEILTDENGEPYVDEDGDPLDVEYFFNSLYWCYPETRLNEIC